MNYWVKPGKPSKLTILYPSHGGTWLDTKWSDSDVEVKFHKWEDMKDEGTHRKVRIR